ILSRIYLRENQVMAKNREYDYDQITKKLTKGEFKPVKKNETMGDVYSLMGDDSSTKSKKPNVKINTFVPQVTDTNITMTTPPRESSKKKAQNLSEKDLRLEPL
ncbi:TPA: hypothetical protein N0F65_007422, partial [Lagenidium giganteum]